MGNNLEPYTRIKHSGILIEVLLLEKEWILKNLWAGVSSGHFGIVELDLIAQLLSQSRIRTIVSQTDRCSINPRCQG